jgi:hypothetical protein
MGQLAAVIEAPIKGALGTEINVGDTVMVVTTGYSHRVSVTKGVYKGYIQGSYYTQRARIEVEEEHSFWVFKETGEEWSYYKHGPFYDNVDKMERKTEPYTRKTTLNLNRIATITPAEAETVEKIGKLV